MYDNYANNGLNYGTPTKMLYDGTNDWLYVGGTSNDGVSTYKIMMQTFEATTGTLVYNYQQLLSDSDSMKYMDMKTMEYYDGQICGCISQYTASNPSYLGYVWKQIGGSGMYIQYFQMSFELYCIGTKFFISSNTLQLALTYGTQDTTGETKMHIGIISDILASTVDMVVYTMQTV
jgi:hypothetical protein